MEQEDRERKRRKKERRGERQKHLEEWNEEEREMKGRNCRSILRVKEEGTVKRGGKHITKKQKESESKESEKVKWRNWKEK